VSQTVIHGSLKATPHQHPQGMRVAGLLKSELFGLRSTVDSETLRRMDRRNLGPVALEEMDFFGRNARFVLGHNILNHDIPRLKEGAPDLQFFSKSRIDTLFLSPLAYPANPYHRLIKNYQIARDSINDPVLDALLAGGVCRAVGGSDAAVWSEPGYSFALSRLFGCGRGACRDGRSLGLYGHTATEG